MNGRTLPALELDDLAYDLPQELVAQTPADPRDSSRLLVHRRSDDSIEDRVFADLPALLRAGDVLVRNDTRVFPARAYFRRATGGRLEVLFLRRLFTPGEEDVERWEVLVRGRPRPGETVVSETLEDGWPLRCEEPLGEGRWVVVNAARSSVLRLLQEAGVTPLPPYITQPLDDPERYQTTYARHLGSAAAPTAGLHFTPRLDAALAGAGVTVETVTLHVGLGTFKPLQEATLSAGRLHAEEYEVEAAVWARLREARRAGRRLVAVGTTSMRVLEHLARAGEDDGGLVADDEGHLRGRTTLFIRPGFEFRMVDALVTNFHLPRTSLLALVMAFCGAEETRRLYRHAVAARYRFYSFGDAMLAL